MDGLGAGLDGRRHDAVDAQVAVACRRRADVNGLVRDPAMDCVDVSVAIYRDRFDAQLSTSADDPHGNLAAVGYQQTVKGSRPPWTVFAQRHVGFGPLERDVPVFPWMVRLALAVKHLQ